MPGWIYTRPPNFSTQSNQIMEGKKVETKGGFTTEGAGSTNQPAGESENQGQRVPVDNSTKAPGVPSPQPGDPEKPAGSPPSSSTTQSPSTEK